tara:strand:+ start:148 stop:453 length:306 start_codon:yes stop_codon:yes gene_type:complete
LPLKTFCQYFKRGASVIADLAEDEQGGRGRGEAVHIAIIMYELPQKKLFSQLVSCANNGVMKKSIALLAAFVIASAHQTLWGDWAFAWCTSLTSVTLSWRL